MEPPGSTQTTSMRSPVLIDFSAIVLPWRLTNLVAVWLRVTDSGVNEPTEVGWYLTPDSPRVVVGDAVVEIPVTS